MKTQTDKYKKKNYQIGQKIWLYSRNIKSTRPCKIFENKQLGFYKIIAKHGGFYELKLFSNIKIYPIFNPNKLRPYNNDPLPRQKQKRPKPVETDEKKQ